MENFHIISLYNGDADKEPLFNRVMNDARQVLQRQGLVDAGEHNIAERTLVLQVPAGSRWIVIEDDLDLSNAELPSALSRLHDGPLVDAEYLNGGLVSLTLYAGGGFQDHLAVMPEEAMENFTEEQWAEFGQPPVAKVERWITAFGDAIERADFDKAMHSPVPLIEVCRLLQMPIGQEDFSPERNSFILGPVVLRFRHPSSPEGAIITPQEAAALPEGKHLVPAVLCGKNTEVKRRWKSVVRKVVATESWSKGLEGIDLIPLDSAPGQIVMGNMHFFLSGANVCLDYVMHLLRDEVVKGLKHTDDPKVIRERFDVWRKLVLDGMEEFWFCLAVLAQDGPWFLPIFDDSEQPRMAAEMLVKLLKRWKEFPKFQDRYMSVAPMLDRPWSAWGSFVVHLVCAIGMTSKEAPRLLKVDSGEAEVLVRGWLKQSKLVHL